MQEPATTRILIVEDDPDLRELMVDILRNEAGYDAVAGYDAAGCLELLGNGDIDLVLSDVTLYGSWLDDSAFHDKLRRHAEAGRAQVTFVSGRSPHELERENITHYLTKPFEIDEFLSFVEDTLTRRLAGT